MHILGTRKNYKAHTNDLGKGQQNIILNDSRSKKNEILWGFSWTWLYWLPRNKFLRLTYGCHV